MKHREFAWQNRSGLKIYGQSWQPETETRAVVSLVHGLGEHSGRYKHIAEVFTNEGIALMAIDLPGHGQSGGSRGYPGFDTILYDIDALLEHARVHFPNLPQFLYGHSMGGAIVLYYTLKCKPNLTGVISTSPGLAPGQPVPASKLMVAKVMARVLPSFALSNGLDLQNLSQDPAVVQAYQQDKLCHDRISASLGLDLLTKGEWMIAHAQDFPHPLLLVQGSGDHIVSTEATANFAKAVPPDKITYKIWNGLYHETHNEPEKTKVIQYLVKWVHTISLLG